MSTPKVALRQRYRAVRLKMRPAEIDEKSDLICRNLIKELNWEQLRSLLVYKPINELNEADLSTFLKSLRKQRPDLLIDTLGSAPAQPLPKPRYDVIIVPCLAFDKHNYRLGWGGGYYDRLLADQASAVKLGVAFENGRIQQAVGWQPHDVKLDKIITEA